MIISSLLHFIVRKMKKGEYHLVLVKETYLLAVVYLDPFINISAVGSIDDHSRSRISVDIIRKNIYVKSHKHTYQVMLPFTTKYIT